MFDSHCHLQTDAFAGNLQETLTASRVAGVKGFLVPAIDSHSLERTVALAEAEPDVFCAVGIHPHSAKEWTDELRDKIRHTVRSHAKVRALGETGLDYYYDFAPPEVQTRAFREQIELAQELDLPIVIHNRDADDDVYGIVEEYYRGRDPLRPTGQFHCFSGTTDAMHKAVDLGFYVSFTGNITFKKSTLSEVVRATPIDRILIETDAPYLAPHPFRGKQNSPAWLPLVAQKVAEIKELPVESVIQHTYDNALRLFKLASLLVLLVTGSLLATDDVHAQPPVGSRPPDSVMTPERRRQEELLRQQREELAREQAQRRQDSIRRAQEEELEIRQQAEEQLRRDSLRAAEKLEQIERERLRALTPMPWKAIGVGGGIGIGNMAMSQSKPSITPTSVLATTLQIGSHITRGVDLELSFSSMRVADNLLRDSLYSAGEDAPTGSKPGSPMLPGFRVPTDEEIVIKTTGLDVRFVINPRSSFKFYTGIGYTHINIRNRQEYQPLTDTTVKFVYDPSKVKVFEDEFSRGAIKLLFGFRYDIELTKQLTLTPFAQISALGAFQGAGQRGSFVFRPDADQITMTHLNVGATVFFGWFGVDRNPKP